MAIVARTVTVKRIETGPSGPATVTCSFVRTDPPPAAEETVYFEVPAGPALDLFRDAKRERESMTVVSDNASTPEPVVRVTGA